MQTNYAKLNAGSIHISTGLRAHPGRRPLLLHLAPDIGRLYRALSEDRKYGHFVRIPRRISGCLDYFKVAADRAAVIDRLHAYYLFIGVVDDLIDSTQIEAAGEVLRQLVNRAPSFDSETIQSPVVLVTEVLKAHIDARLYPRVLAKFEDLHQAVVGERRAETLPAFIEERKTVGRLTAELSYILISPLLERDDKDLLRFLEDVGEVGCLIDSLIDLRADREQRLLSFSLTWKDRLSVVAQVMRQGMKLSVAHPRLIVLFLEAVGDNLLDRLRSTTAPGVRLAIEPAVEPRNGVVATESLSAVVGTKP